jgi:hypothetical protein
MGPTKSDHNKWLITITVIILSGFHLNKTIQKFVFKVLEEKEFTFCDHLGIKIN